MQRQLFREPLSYAYSLVVPLIFFFVSFKRAGSFSETNDFLHALSEYLVYCILAAAAYQPILTIVAYRESGIFTSLCNNRESRVTLLSAIYISY